MMHFLLLGLSVGKAILHIKCAFFGKICFFIGYIVVLLKGFQVDV